MKRIVATALDESQSPRLRLYCLGSDGEVDHAVTDTLMRLVQESGPLHPELDKLINEAQTGHYFPTDPLSPDWTGNGLGLWLPSTLTSSGLFAVTNDHSAATAGKSQLFSFEQFWTVANHWRRFLQKVEQQGIAAYVGQNYEAPLL